MNSSEYFACFRLILSVLDSGNLFRLRGVSRWFNKITYEICKNRYSQQRSIFHSDKSKGKLTVCTLDEWLLFSGECGNQFRILVGTSSFGPQSLEKFIPSISKEDLTKSFKIPTL